MRAITRPLVSASIAAALAGGVVFLSPDSFSSLERLLLGVPVLVVAYLGMLLYVMSQKAVYLDLLRNVTRQFSAGPGSSNRTDRRDDKDSRETGID